MAKNSKAESKIAGSKEVILTSVLCAIVLIGVIVWAMITKANNALVNKVAMTVGETEISGVEMEYQYNDAILQFQTEFGDYISYLGVDFESDLDKQTYSEDMSWKDYFMDSAIKTLSERYLLVNAAEDAGYALSAEDKDAVLSDLKGLEDQLGSVGINMNAYLSSVYGEEITYDLFKEFSLSNTVAYNYLVQVLDSFDIDEATLKEYYESNKDNVDTVSFRFHQFGYTVPADVAEGDESYKADAKAKADAALAAITDEASFDGAVSAQLGEDAGELSTLSENVLKENLIPDLATWLFDGARVEGDKAVIEGNGGYFVVYFCTRELADYETVNVRHILFATEDVEHVHDAETDEHDEAATVKAQEEADAKVYAEAEAVLNEWLAGDKTEDSFAELADKHSADNAPGGLYSQVTKGMMIEEFDAWIFDPARKTGDYEIVETDYGYHLMYFVGNDDIAWKIDVRNIIEGDMYEDYKAELEAKYEVVTYDEVLDLVG